MYNRSSFQVATDDDGGDEVLSQLTFEAQPNTDYFMILEGYSTICGKADVQFQVSPSPPPPSPTSPPSSPIPPPSPTSPPLSPPPAPNPPGTFSPEVQTSLYDPALYPRGIVVSSGSHRHPRLTTSVQHYRITGDVESQMQILGRTVPKFIARLFCRMASEYLHQEFSLPMSSGTSTRLQAALYLTI